MLLLQRHSRAEGRACFPMIKGLGLTRLGGVVAH